MLGLGANQTPSSALEARLPTAPSHGPTCCFDDADAHIINSAHPTPWAFAARPAAVVGFSPNSTKHASLVLTWIHNSKSTRWLVRARPGGQRAGSCRRSSAISRKRRWLNRCPLSAPSPLTPHKRQETDFFSGEPLRALSTLVFSDNIDLQRSASLTFAEITERGAYIRPILAYEFRPLTRDPRADVREVDRDTLEPILFLLQSSDIEVQRAASAALGNLAVNSTSRLLLNDIRASQY